MKQSEFERLIRISEYENSFYNEGAAYIAGVDEAGRGPLAGPVVAGCIILPRGYIAEGVNDSKKVSPEKREILFDILCRDAVAFGIGIVDQTVIDEINILNATKSAMTQAIEQLAIVPDVILLDAVRLDSVRIRQLPLIKGDSLSISIAAASILAKVTRDRIMVEYDRQYPEYGFAKHKGYGTAEHMEAIARYGICPIHRKSFAGC
jgi:ribonuclease HII